MKILIALGVAFALNLSAIAGEGKEVTLKGTGLCAKCSLKQADSCTNALQVKNEAGELKTYIFTKNMKHEDLFCKGSTPGLVVTGILTEKDGKLLITPKSVEKESES